jgi:hypothetical protein
LEIKKARGEFMSVTTIEGVVENGQVRLPATVRLPERAKVYVVVPDAEVPSVAYVASPRLVHPEQASDFEKVVVEENGDAGL